MYVLLLNCKKILMGEISFCVKFNIKNDILVYVKIIIIKINTCNKNEVSDESA